MKPKYTKVSLAEGLARQIDEIVTDPRYGYTSRAQFVAEAIRERLITLRRFK